MESKASVWTPREFLAYLLLYAAHVDENYCEKERTYILSKVEYKTYQKVFQEFSQDNGYQRLQKITTYQQVNSAYTSTLIMTELKNLFVADNEFHHLEEYTLNTIRRLIVA